MRNENSESVVVIAAIFIKKGFLEKESNYEKVMKIMLNSEEEKKCRSLNAWSYTIIITNKSLTYFCSMLIAFVDSFRMKLSIVLSPWKPNISRKS